MHKEIRVVDLERGIVQLTTLDERFYSKTETDPETGVPEIVFRPSVSWIVEHYPKGTGFQKWLKTNGDDADLIARLAADRGYKVHEAVAVLNQGGTVVGMSGGPKEVDKFRDPSTGEEVPLSAEEWAGVLSYADWQYTEGRQMFSIEGSEFVTWPDPQTLADETGYPLLAFSFAGMIDLKVKQILDKAEMQEFYKGWKFEKGSTGIIDFKTSKDVWPAHKCQAAAYATAEKADWAAIIQLNYVRTKTKRWKFTQVDVKHWFRLFMSTKNIWSEENEGVYPMQRDYPFEVKLGQEVKVP
jgi:hypothetical protein